MRRLTLSKIILILCLLFVMITGAAYYRYVYNKPYNLLANPYDDIREGISKLDDNKLLVVVLGANWCPECRALASDFNNVDFIKLISSSYSVVKVDVNGWDRNMDIVEDLGNPVKGGIPTILLIDKNKRILLTRTGSQLANDKKRHGSYLAYFTYLIESYRSRNKGTEYSDGITLDI